jgi:hypothetical protein
MSISHSIKIENSLERKSFDNKNKVRTKREKEKVHKKQIEKRKFLFIFHLPFFFEKGVYGHKLEKVISTLSKYISGAKNNKDPFSMT